MSTPEVILCDDNLHPAALGSLVSLGTFDELAHHPAAIDVDPERQLQEALESKTQGNRYEWLHHLQSLLCLLFKV